MNPHCAVKGQKEQGQREHFDLTGVGGGESPSRDDLPEEGCLD